MITQRVIFLLLLVLATTYDISYQCSTSGCAPNCQQCFNLNGGPFQDISTCMDPVGGCNKNGSFNLTMECSGCTLGKDCAFTWYLNSLTIKGCTNDEDKHWDNLKKILNLLYVLHINANDLYNWCGNACTLSVGAILGIVAAVVGVLGVLGLGIHFYLKCK